MNYCPLGPGGYRLQWYNWFKCFTKCYNMKNNMYLILYIARCWPVEFNESKTKSREYKVMVNHVIKLIYAVSRTKKKPNCIVNAVHQPPRRGTKLKYSKKQTRFWGELLLIYIIYVYILCIMYAQPRPICWFLRFFVVFPRPSYCLILILENKYILVVVGFIDFIINVKISISKLCTVTNVRYFSTPQYK